MCILHLSSSTKELFTSLDNLERVFCSKRRLFETSGLVELNSPKFDLFFDIEEHSEEETIEEMTKTMEQYMSKTRGDYGGSEHEDANEYIEKVLEIVDLFRIPNIAQDQIMLRDFLEIILFYNGLDVLTRQILDSKGVIPSMTAANAKGLAAIQAQLNNLGREIKKVNKKVYAAQVGCELCKGPHYTKDYLLKEEGKTLEEAYYTQFGAPYQPGRQYRGKARILPMKQRKLFVPRLKTNYGGITDQIHA
ncbi:hypothetical protein Tco_1328735 [Tanacetum coccineum]